MTGKVAHILTLALCVGIPLLVGAVSGFATARGIHTWYPKLNKPAFNPPNAVFAPVWTALYLLMGISLYLVWRTPDSPERTLALLAFATQLALNFAWSFLFFYFRRIGLALGEIFLLWICILAMILLFQRVSGLAALLQVPYLIWVGFAALLNASIRVRNPTRPRSGE